VTDVKSLRLVIQRFFQDLLGGGFQIAASDKDTAFLAFEESAAFVFSRATAAQERRTIGVFVGDIKSLRCLEEHLRMVNHVTGFNFHRPAVVHAQSPLCNIEMMSTPVGHLPSGIIPEKPE